jgi:hypothetical protein
LNGDLQEKVYIAPPPSVSHDFGYVSKLKKTLYGLKQAPRAWFQKFSVVISSIGFVSSSHDSALFRRESSPMELFIETHVRSEDCQKGVQQFVDNRAQHFMVCLLFHFIS